MTRLTGAAAAAHARRIILDEARDAITRRDRHAVSDVVALLRLADAKTPRKAPVVPFLPGDTDELVVTRYGAHGPAWGRIDVRVRPLVQPSRVPTPGPQPAAPVERGHRVPRMGGAR